MTETKTVALVTGANKGLGRETVRRLAGEGWRVFLAARDRERGVRAADELAGAGLAVEFVELDVTSDESVAAAAKAVAERVERLDVLVNNAGVGGPMLDPADMDADALRVLYEVNVFGQVRVTHAFLPLLRKSAQPRVVMVSSGLASLTHAGDPARPEHGFLSLDYASSKAALNMVVSQYARALPGFQVNAADPGNPATDMNHHTGVHTVEEGASAIIRLATLDAGGPTGGFFGSDGPVPW
ncbi:NAD(P)-dependent dehydrogenase (short-subunit alcohol dehydrogenase family) [Actinocorallia herbida]|uniref:NAD(P)-dependent dehydrogenase (Short-subunit alcohol dehydrogenase family) n=1 Tax=Actinocorallia herbida TaxID=58109 RepID=A0A3N1CVM5_9ACTN|nr:SDR family oxidoreductase [Actinocorallia herbida]ROO85295.1 NAD(P)-dependent dehydrogenase (short-subunit alcohol dehydrogenase family) [Actinocorallia herbida]